MRVNDVASNNALDDGGGQGFSYLSNLRGSRGESEISSSCCHVIHVLTCHDVVPERSWNLIRCTRVGNPTRQLDGVFYWTTRTVARCPSIHSCKHSRVIEPRKRPSYIDTKIYIDTKNLSLG
jgi:hypothetical protein